MVVGAKVCELTDDFLWFVCGLHFLDNVPHRIYHIRGDVKIQLPRPSMCCRQ